MSPILKKWLNRREGSRLEISGSDPIILKGSWHHSLSLMAPPLGFAMRQRRRRRRNVRISPAVLSSLIRDVNGFLGVLRRKGLNSSGRRKCKSSYDSTKITVEILDFLMEANIRQRIYPSLYSIFEACDNNAQKLSVDSGSTSVWNAIVSP